MPSIHKLLWSRTFPLFGLTFVGQYSVIFVYNGFLGLFNDVDFVVGDDAVILVQVYNSHLQVFRYRRVEDDNCGDISTHLTVSTLTCTETMNLYYVTGIPNTKTGLRNNSSYSWRITDLTSPLTPTPKWSFFWTLLSIYPDGCTCLILKSF